MNKEPTLSGWHAHVARLRSGETVEFREKGHSMEPHIKDRALCTPTKFYALRNELVSTPRSFCPLHDCAFSTFPLIATMHAARKNTATEIPPTSINQNRDCACRNILPHLRKRVPNMHLLVAMRCKRGQAGAGVKSAGIPLESPRNLVAQRAAQLAARKSRKT